MKTDEAFAKIFANQDFYVHDSSDREFEVIDYEDYSVILFTHVYPIYSFTPFLSFVKGCNLEAKSLFLTKIFNQRRLQVFYSL